MNKWLFLASAAVLLGLGTLGRSPLPEGWVADLIRVEAPVAAASPSAGAKILTAANAFLEGLGDSQRRRVVFDAGDEERTNWHFIPRTRQGVSLGELGDEQRRRALALLRASLSAKGFKKAEDVRQLEAVLREIEGPQRRFARDPYLYHVSIFGAPSEDDRWGWRFEGHHLAFNFTLDGARLVGSTPAFYGANPAEIQKGPWKGLRVLAATEDLARELVQSLDEEQLRRCRGEAASVPKEVPETQVASYRGPFPRGVTASELGEEQRDTLRRLLVDYRNNLVEDAPVDIPLESLEGVRFAWGGGLQRAEAHSYLIHGPRFVINYSNFQNGANHIHASLRDL